MKRKSAIIVAILIMCIGFAAISTTLIINGNARISENTDDFSVIFTATSLDGQDVYANVISQDKKTITFETKELKTLNQTSMLNYEVTNNSANYDAEVSVNCKVKDNTEAKYTSIKNELENNATVVKAKESVNGTLTVTLNKTATEEVIEEYVCTLAFNAAERNELGSYTGQTEWLFDYTGGEQTFVAPVTGVYKLETWGAQGGTANSTYVGGYGGYSTGKINLKKNSEIYVDIGGQGESSTTSAAGFVTKGGYNGGGSGKNHANLDGRYVSAGGGATHISYEKGLLSTLESKKDSILIVSSGGSGSGYYSSDYYVVSPGHGGGFEGTTGSTYYVGQVLTNFNIPNQTSGYAFGLGESGKSEGAGAGGGYYGGYTTGSLNGSGGSSYIGNPLLTEKSMYCYNCQESPEESTKTISTTCISETPTENCAKSGNGYARITLIK